MNDKDKILDRKPIKKHGLNYKELFIKKIHHKILKIIFQNKGTYVSNMTRYMTYSHASMLIALFSEQGYIRTNKIGRISHLYLTEKGKRLLFLLDSIEKIVGDAKLR